MEIKPSSSTTCISRGKHLPLAPVHFATGVDFDAAGCTPVAARPSKEAGKPLVRQLLIGSLANGDVELTSCNRNGATLVGTTPDLPEGLSSPMSQPSGEALKSQLQIKSSLRRAKVWSVTVNNIAFMCVPRSIPACLAATGWELGICALAWSSVVTYDTGLLIGKLCAMRPHCSSFPELAGEAAAQYSLRRGASSAKEIEIWRRRAGTWTLCLQFVTYYLTSVAELIYFEQFCGQLFEGAGLCQWQWLIIVAVASLPTLQVPTFNASRWMALLVGVVPLLINCAVMVYEIFLVRPWECKPGPSFELPSTTSAFLGVTAFAYTFGGHGFYPEEIREMRQPSQWGQVMHYTYAVALPLYWGCGLLGYYAYGDFAQANINLNFPLNGANTMSVAVQVVQELYFILSSNLVMMLSIELALGIDPSSCGTPLWKMAASAPRSWPWAKRLLVRSLFFASEVFVAQILLSGEGDTLLALQSLTGAVGMTAFTYFLPYAFYMMLSPTPLSKVRLTWSVANILLGLLAMAVGFLSSMRELFVSSATLFEGECLLPYAYSPRSPHDPCYISGIAQTAIEPGTIEAAAHR